MRALFLVLWLLAAGAAPEFEVGRFIKGGARGEVHEISGQGIPADSVVKIYKPKHEPPFTAAQVEGMAERYAAIHKLFPDNTMPVHSVKEITPGIYGVVMGKIPEKIRIYNAEWASAKTIRDLERIRDTLIEKKLYIADFSYTIREDGSVILYDLDYVKSWSPQSPFYDPKVSDAKAAEFKKTVDFWIEMAKEDIAKRR